MKQEDNDLKLKYLCMALPYGVICNDNRHGSGRVTYIDITPDDIEQKNDKVVVYYFDFDECGELKNCKPYLRPMSSMTEEERFELEQIIGSDVEVRDDYFYLLSPSVKRLSYAEILAVFAWLLKHHFDFMGLIPKDLAIEVTKKNNPYKN
jgi:hypothetical protein